MSKEITAYSFGGVNISWKDEANMAYIDQGDDSVEIEKDLMTQIAIQWLCLHAPKAIKED